MKPYLTTILLFISVFSFEQWDFTGGILQTILMIYSTGMIIKVQYERLYKRKEEEEFDKKCFNAFVLLPTVMIISTCSFIPQGEIIRMLLLVCLDIAHCCGVVLTKGDPKLRKEFVADVVCISSCILIVLKYCAALTM